ncbi:MAG: AHH domain-containing protein [Ktedonobacterales bacterium]
MAQDQPGGTLAGHVRVAPRDLDQAGQQFRAQAQNLEAQVSAPLNAVEQGNGAAWASGSHTEYLRLHNNLLGTLRHAQQTTHHLGVGMSQSGGAYGVLNQTRFNAAPMADGDGLDPFDTIRVAGSHSQELSEHMVAAGVTRPPNTAAHHIVAWNDPRAGADRAILTANHIGVDDAENGVFLPRFQTSPNPSGNQVHSTTHTNLYFQEVDRRISAAAPRGAVAIKAALAQIAIELQAGTFPV